MAKSSAAQVTNQSVNTKVEGVEIGDAIPIPLMKEILLQLVTMRPRRAPFIWGPPGIGKTSIVYQVGDMLGYEVYELRLGEHDPVDLRGMPVPVLKLRDGREIYLHQPPKDGIDYTEVMVGVTKWFIPNFLAFGDKPAILFLDEMNQADRSVQKVAQRLVLQYQIGDFTLPQNVVVVAAGNAEDHGSFVQKMAKPTLNRFFHYLVGVDVDGWLEWAENNGIHPMVIAYINFNRDALFVFDPKSVDKSFPTPRTWEFVSDALNHGMYVGLYHTIVAAIGKLPAIAFKAFMDVHAQIPDINEIFINPTGAPLPTNPSVRFSLCILLANRATHKNFGAIRAYVERMGHEYCAYTVNYATRMKKILSEIPEFVQWAVEYQDLLVDERSLVQPKAKKGSNGKTK